jgi:agmatinase
VGIVGGEHSVPLGLIRALHEQHNSFGILHIDAHADLRCAYEGFVYSHASVMYHAGRMPGISLCQVGIRDYWSDEADLMGASEHIHCFSDQELRRKLFEGTDWNKLCRQIIDRLPDKVYISFDIDGLSPDNCPHTGTPVPGGLSFREADYLLHCLALSPKRIIGFDLCEVAPGKDSEWDANVGARMLYKLCCYTHFCLSKKSI